MHIVFSLKSDGMSSDDDDVMIVEGIKNEPPLDIQEPQTESTTVDFYYRNASNDSAIHESMSNAQLLSEADHLERSDAERFGSFVAQSLAKLPTKIQRRQLEIQIEIAILKAKQAAFQ